MWAGEACDEEETFICEIFFFHLFPRDSPTIRTFWKEIRKQEASFADVFATVFAGSFPGLGKTSHRSWRFGRHTAVRLPELSWDQNGTLLSLFPFCFTSPTSQGKDVLSGAFPAGVAQTEPQETSVAVSCSSPSQEQPLQEALVQWSFISCLPFCLFSWEKKKKEYELHWLQSVRIFTYGWEYYGLQEFSEEKHNES